ncbi:arsenate reductase ArsC [Thiobacillus sp.]|uniref:arsenate reductase ArsC n=1 Tax=Thiobacillus sp. TaxID=924 RepID=UPI0025FFB1E4|nr:arsenate reductase ArsC [Thiobacillus sp.]MBT9539498.1 arsenate reductase ArsC [Thiobacillus sp.]
MAEAAFNVLFLCAANSARSILAECLLNAMGEGRFHAYSAGSQPAGQIHPEVLELLHKSGLATAGLHSKSWDAFAAAGAPRFDFIITVCDDMAGEACPVWPGHPITAHWHIPDPVRAQGSDAHRQHAFVEAMSQLQQHISALICLPFATLDKMKLGQTVRDIGNPA